MKTPGGILAVLCSVAAVTAKPGVDQQIVQLESSNSKLLQYPTQFTQSIMPKAIHSHNDYWRDVPLLTALSYGVASVEADVSLINGTLYVGHENQALTPDRTLDSLYIQPLLQILNNQNPQTEFTAGSTSHNGVFDVDGGQTLQFVIEIKTDGVATLPSVLAALEPLRSAGYLTTFANGTLSRSAVTVVGTGNSPLEQIKELSPRDFFYDAPLSQLTDPSLNTTWDATLAPLASTDYEAVIGWNGFGTISDEQKGNITKFVGDAHERGIAARFWNTPAWPVSARENIWRALLENGADWLNADDLAAASSF